jgi:tRNA pseudouridine32 synthase/23S rRNA pseudouridine746 synthase
MLGDSLYAPPDIKAQSPRLLLHAQELAFMHPFTEQALAFKAQVQWSALSPYITVHQPQP